MFRLAKAKNQPNFGMQWKKDEDFLNEFLKEYCLIIVWRKTPFNFYKIIE
ncbi:hypothetical protein YBT1518_p00035 (plasmid) [Bacillus thuringiensis YBT-1518]|uniref:Uncharacterized protein n=1 Tax=Bacillus thuringiensis YBT-1518 TaxID=529122 RepID=A0A9W3K7R7_BACTU|nr:hypothetical protein YBT1518_p00035 [Bacillus thuringiensis YBT-1518]